MRLPCSFSGATPIVASLTSSAGPFLYSNIARKGAHPSDWSADEIVTCRKADAWFDGYPTRL